MTIRSVLQYASLMALLGAMSACTTLSSRSYYVAPDGDPANHGTPEAPFATLEQARDAIRAARARHPQRPRPVTVYLRAGVYPRSHTFELTGQDSGSPQAPVVYRACGDEEVRLTGGKRVGGFTPVSDLAVLARLPESSHGHVLQADLRAQGVTDFGEMRMRGFPQPIRPASLELFFDGEPMPLARWPNGGWAVTGRILDPGSIPRQGDTDNRPGTFAYKEDRPARWGQAEDVWLFGYWCWDWADELIRVAAIDTATRSIHLAAPHHYGLKEGMRYYAMNLLEELDRPGEWYLDRTTGLLYFWPPGPIDEAEVWVSLLEAPMLSMRDVSRVTFQGITFECMRGTAIRMVGGEQNRIEDCTIRNAGNLGIILGEGAGEDDVVGLLGCSVHSRSYQNTVWNRHAGTAHHIDGCELYNLGEGGIILGGGDRIDLTPGRNAVTNCDIHHYSRLVTTNRPAVWIDGVGNRAAHNRIHHAPHTAIMFWGNDHAIEFNEFFDVCRETGDVGVIYTGRDWTMRGTSIRYNYIHDVHGPGHIGAQAIYLDDQACGTTCFGNVIVNVQRAFLIGGGRDNVVENNVVVDCPISFHVDARGLGWAADNEDIMLKRLKAVPYLTEPWRSRYPRLVGILDDEPGAPKGNAIRANLIHNCPNTHIDDHARKDGVFEHNVTLDEPGFADAPNGDYRLSEESPVFGAIPGFQRIPFDRIGPQDQPLDSGDAAP